jgi:hypothetical protein
MTGSMTDIGRGAFGGYLDGGQRVARKQLARLCRSLRW